MYFTNNPDSEFFILLLAHFIIRIHKGFHWIKLVIVVLWKRNYEFRHTVSDTLSFCYKCVITLAAIKHTGVLAGFDSDPSHGPNVPFPCQPNALSHLSVSQFMQYLLFFILYIFKGVHTRALQFRVSKSVSTQNGKLHCITTATCQ